MADLARHKHSIGFQSQNGTKDLLVAKLDEGLARYLRLLDEYETARAVLQRSLSRGFLNLAQANFKSPNKIPYGQDFYDERMQATLHVSTDNLNPRFIVYQPRSKLTKATTDPEQLINPKNSDEKTTKPTDESGLQDGATAKAPLDPLRWFGILVPHTLRQAQQDFQSVVTYHVATVLNVRTEMEELERQIENRRREIRERNL